MPNRLATSTSPYLRQHAENPVDWREWGPEAFAEAAERDVPVFLSIGYASCHWCHVMAHESFEDDEVARVLNNSFVSVKVDREERPDVDTVHMAATQAMTGQGGWPMTVLLTPDGRPWHAGTYYSKPQLLQLLDQAQAAWGHHRPDALAYADKLTQTVVRTLGGGAAGTVEDAGNASDSGHPGARETGPARMPGTGTAAHPPLSGEQLRDAVAALTREFDQEHPGFGRAPKFPPSATLLHLVRHAERTGEAWADAMAQRIGDAMARGGIHDQLGGGFARYAVDRAWTVPHFEKMLYDNAQLLRAYAHLWRTSGQPIFERAARGIVAFLARDLRTPQGPLASALDADTPTDGRAVEGGTYVWTLKQLNDTLGIRNGTLAAEVFHVHVEGNAESVPGASVLQLPRDPREVVDRLLEHHANAPIPEAAREDAAAWFEDVRARLLAARAERPQPERDDKVVTAWNGLAITALAEAGAIFEEPTWVRDAAAIAAYLLDVHHTDGRWRRASIDGVAGLADATSEDLGDLAEGLLALHEITGEEHWLDTARGVLEDAIEAYAVSPDSPGAGGFFDAVAHPADGVDLLVRPRTLVDLAEPCGTSALASALWRWARQAPAQSWDAAGSAAADENGNLGTDASHVYTAARFAAAARRAIATTAPHARAAPRFAGASLATAEAMAAHVGV